MFFVSFFFNDTATTEIYTLPYTTLFRSRSSSRHGSHGLQVEQGARPAAPGRFGQDALPSRRNARTQLHGDRKSTRLNSSHSSISYAVFCLKKKKKCDPNTLRRDHQPVYA